MKKVAQLDTETRHVLDVRGMILPFTLLKFTHGFRKMGTGEVMEIIGANLDTRNDILKVLVTLPCKVLSVRNEKDCYLIRLRKLRDSEAYKEVRGFASN